MSYFRIDLKCNTCETIFLDQLVLREEYSKGLSCDCKEGKLVQIYTTPPNVATATYPDGHDRGDQWKKAKEELKLKKQLDNTPQAKSGDLIKEIKKLNR